MLIPKGATLRDVRTGVEGYRFPAALRVMARTKPSLHIFEYRGETLYVHEGRGLMDGTTEVEADPAMATLAKKKPRSVDLAPADIFVCHP